MTDQRPMRAASYLAILIAVWGAGQLGWLSSVDGWFYDRLTRLTPFGESSPSPTLLVELKSSSLRSDRDAWRELVDKLVAQEARVIGLIDPPSDYVVAGPAPLGPVTKVLTAKSLVSVDASGQRYRWLEPIAGQPHNSDHDSLETIPTRADPPTPERIPDAGVSAPLLQGGIARDAPTRYSLEQAEVPSLPYAMAAAFKPEATLPKSPFGVDFSGRKTSLPRVAFERARGGGLLDQMVSGKAVLVAWSNPAAVGVTTPDGGTPITAAQFHALALDTLISGRWIKTLGASALAVLVVGVGALIWLLQLMLGPRASSWAFLGVIGLLLVTAWAILTSAQTWVPLTAPMLGAITIFALTRSRRLNRLDQHLRALVLESAAQLDQHRLPEGVYASREYWSQIAAMVSQLLDLKRTLFLERVPGDHRLREVHALHCEFDEIEERRRDYLRSPYSDAIEENGPFRVEGPYLHPREDEETYLLPLMLGGEVLGFWVFAVAPLTGPQQALRLRAAEILGRELANLLDQRERWRQRTSQQQRLWSRLVWDRRTRSTAEVLGTTLDRLGRRLAVMDSVLNGIDSAAILYDTFGRVVQVNQRMVQTLQLQGVAAFDLTALDLLAHLTGEPLDQARDQLRRLILERESLSQAVKWGSSGGTFLLQARPLLALEDERSQPFELLGVLLELIDLREAQEVFTLKEELISYLGAQYRDALEVINLATGLLAKPELDDSRRGVVMEAMNSKLNEIVDFAHSVEGFLSRDLAAVPTDQFPVSPLKMVESVIQEVEPLCASRRIEIRSTLPRVIGLVKSSPQLLGRTLRALMHVLIEDCSEDGELRLELSARDGRVVLSAENTGFGLPNERLQTYLTGDEELSSTDLRALREARNSLAQWDGELLMESDVGDGIRATLQLKLFS